MSRALARSAPRESRSPTPVDEQRGHRHDRERENRGPTVAASDQRSPPASTSRRARKARPPAQTPAAATWTTSLRTASGPSTRACPDRAGVSAIAGGEDGEAGASGAGGERATGRGRARARSREPDLAEPRLDALTEGGHRSSVEAEARRLSPRQRDPASECEQEAPRRGDRSHTDARARPGPSTRRARPRPRREQDQREAAKRTPAAQSIDPGPGFRVEHLLDDARRLRAPHPPRTRTRRGSDASPPTAPARRRCTFRRADRRAATRDLGGRLLTPRSRPAPPTSKTRTEPATVETASSKRRTTPPACGRRRPVSSWAGSELGSRAQTPRQTERPARARRPHHGPRRPPPASMFLRWVVRGSAHLPPSFCSSKQAARGSPPPDASDCRASAGGPRDP